MKKFMLIFLSIIAALAVGITLFVWFAPQFGAAAHGQSLERIQKSPQYRDGKFQNISPTPMMGEQSLTEKVKIFAKFLGGVEGATPEDELPQVKLTPADFPAPSASEIKVTWFGHSAVLLEVGGKRIFADPMLGQRASPVSFIGSKRFNKELPIAMENLPALDVVLLSHDHYDHLDHGSIKKLMGKTRHFFVPLGVAAHLVKWGVAKEKITELDWWETAQFEGLFLAAAPARHFSGRGLTDRDQTLWCSWVVKAGEQSVYFGGDSGYDRHFKQIGEKYGPFDLTMLECGQYNEAWKYIHMMPEETAQAHLDLKGKVLMPTHWGAFSLALHHWKEPIKRLTKAAARQHIQLATPLMGQRWRVGQELPTQQWWKPLL
ncbi:MBL fold metallo-hydrolase [Rufibacter quisquiliarum]|uniref:L-ascorbate metabolism protein UlaG (Beta-lactamase superfamily) n=1 Tax=Rufibacter quisquiliarum TaxID=1549639 RepID=A0A839GNP6_9BACT|nr:MBL fold metallo-hydrolase [Rufibacter quisquiliarum]MBA9076058.1 L-ascorbate metabolism protein UlaG (beta-lactamase superfamily) [Rufibacter quisquiliarum]